MKVERVWRRRSQEPERELGCCVSVVVVVVLVVVRVVETFV